MNKIKTKGNCKKLKNEQKEQTLYVLLNSSDFPKDLSFPKCSKCTNACANCRLKYVFKSMNDTQYEKVSDSMISLISQS
ncbi:hypothetical protein DID78_05735 [Candidatus Marinamargulisbacteria bacterium SCGC AG-343-D04]|nr:hypothetical protein DID78_05735 [Candidatus Marinamargulisbacteria bacterium SCGC AG-343-D04]